MAAKLKINSVAEIDGKITDRLTVLIDNIEITSVIISNPMTIDCAIEKLQLMAWDLKIHNTK